MKKECTECKKECNFDNFHKGNDSYGLSHKCKECIKAYDKIRYDKNKDKINKYCREYHKKNRDILLARKRRYSKQNKELLKKKRKENYERDKLDPLKKELRKRRSKRYYKKHKEEINRKNYKRKRERLKSDPVFRLKEFLRSRLRSVIVNKTKTSAQYGVDFDKIVEHLGPCPGNLEDYHIDHILPLSAFNYNDEIEIWASWLPENHQWLIKEENLKKWAKYDKIDYIKYMKEKRKEYFINFPLPTLS